MLIPVPPANFSCYGDKNRQLTNCERVTREEIAITKSGQNGPHEWLSALLVS